MNQLLSYTATILTEGYDSAGMATALTMNNDRTGSAGIKYCKKHPPTEKASSGMCTRRSNDKLTYRPIRMLYAHVTMMNEILTQSRQPRDTQLFLEIDFTISPSHTIWQLKKP